MLPLVELFVFDYFSQPGCSARSSVGVGLAPLVPTSISDFR